MNDKWISALKVALPITILAIAGVAAAALSSLRQEPEQRRAAPQLPLVRVITVRLADTPITVLSQGTVRPRAEGRLVPEVAGRVVWISPRFVTGGFFEAGQPLLRIDPHDYEQARIRATAEVASARLRLAQEEAEAAVARREWEQLGEGEPPALTARLPQLENARAALAAAEANRMQAERNLERTTLAAPYAGRVRDKSVDTGQFVTAGAPLGSIYAIDVAEIRLPLPDEDLAFLAELPLVYRGEATRGGARVRLRAEFAGRVHEWQGRLVRTEGEIDPTSRMVHAVAQVRNPYGRGEDPERPPLAVGMYVQAAIEGAVAEAVAVLPRAALRPDGRVLVVDDNDAIRFRDIEILRQTRESVIVSGGLADGERVVLSSLDAVTDGMRVRLGADPMTAARTDPAPDGRADPMADTDGARR